MLAREWPELTLKEIEYRTYKYRDGLIKECLLRHIKSLFEEPNRISIEIDLLMTHLLNRQLWVELKLTHSELKEKLKLFGIKSHRANSRAVYLKNDFAETWRHYCSDK